MKDPSNPLSIRPRSERASSFAQRLEDEAIDEFEEHVGKYGSMDGVEDIPPTALLKLMLANAVAPAANSNISARMVAKIAEMKGWKGGEGQKTLDLEAEVQRVLARQVAPKGPRGAVRESG